ncbi:MAG TPA: cache domain-containing protein, partial [Xanthobacteraceae bacterium]
MTLRSKIAPQLRARNSVRVFLHALVAIVLAPALLLAGYFATSLARSERARLEQNAEDQTREAVAAVERDFVAIQNVLATLAGSPYLQSGDIESFYAQATNVSRIIGLAVILRDVHSDQQIANTGFPWGTVLAGKTRDPLAASEVETLRAGKPIVTDVFFGPHTNEYLVSAIAPVFHGGDLQFYLSAAVPLKRSAELLSTLDVRPDQFVSVIDRNGVLVARSLKQDKFAGTHRSLRFPTDSQGVVHGVNREGLPFHSFYRHSDLLGWDITTAVLDSVLDAP